MIAELALLLALTGGGQAGPEDLPRCSDVDLSDWTPEDGQVCLAEDDPGWTPEEQEDWAQEEIDVVIYPDPKVVVLNCDPPANDVLIVEDPNDADNLLPPKWDHNPQWW